MWSIGGSHPALAVACSAVALLAASGCSPETLKSGGQGTGGGAAAVGGRAAGSGGAMGAGDAAITPGPVSGSFETASASATISFPGGGGYLEENPDGTFDFLLAMPGMGPGPQLTFATPPGGSLMQFQISMTLGGASPGTYQSGGGCGRVSVFFSVPSSMDAATCGSLTDAGICPAGCMQRTVLLPGSSPCTSSDFPGPFLYHATGTASCASDVPQSVGSWTLSLTSMVPTTEVSGGPAVSAAYLTHGTVTAVLPAGFSVLGSDGGGAAFSPSKLWLQF